MTISEEIEYYLDILARRRTPNYESEEKFRRRLYENFARWLVETFEKEPANG
jgi:hypothetical protein